MNMSSEIIKFSENAQEELSLLANEMHLGKILEAIGSQGQIPEALKDDLRSLLLMVTDLFGTDLPPVEADPMETLRLASRDINLSRILRERGLFRLYRLLNTKVESVDEHGIVSRLPIFQTQKNPDTGEIFRRREDFIGWFCHAANVARATVFMRMATIDHMLGLDIPLDEAYQLILAGPSAMRDLLNTVAEWDREDLVDIKPEVAERLADHLLPEKVERVRELGEIINNEDASLEDVDEAREELAQTMRPAIAELAREVAAHPSIKDAMEMVRIDIAGKPEINYRWDPKKEEFTWEVVRRKKDPQGTEYISEVLNGRMIMEPILPPELKQDMVTRLPLKNREVI